MFWDAHVQPSLYPGHNIFEKVPKKITNPFLSIDFKDGRLSPLNLNSPYGLSSKTGISYLLIISMNFLRLSSVHVMPVGFWKSGIT